MASINTEQLPPDPKQRGGCLLGGLIRLFITSPVFRMMLFAVVICLCLIVLMFAFNLLMNSAANHVQTALNTVFGGTAAEVKRNETVILTGIFPATEIITAKMTGEVSASTSDSWGLSTKTLKAKATFTARAAFDFRKTLPTIFLTNYGQPQKIEIPEPFIILELSDFFYELENGWWNKVKSEDITNITNEIRPLAEEKVKEMGLFHIAKQELEKRIQETFPDRDIEIVWIPNDVVFIPQIPL